jgi:hypothetical protein
MRLMVITLVLLPLALLGVSCATRRIPAPLPSLKSTTDYLDLRPGVRLSVEKAYYTPGAARRGLTGYMGTRVATFGIKPNGDLLLVSEQSKPFQGGPPNQLPSEPLLPPYMRSKRAYRFFYAVTFARSSRPSASVLLGARSMKEIEELSAKLKAAPDDVCTPQSVRCTVFPEGSTVSISMEIVVNGTAQVVLWGSVVGNVTGGRPASRVERMASGRLETVPGGGNQGIRLLPGDRVSF